MDRTRDHIALLTESLCVERETRTALRRDLIEIRAGIIDELQQVGRSGDLLAMLCLEETHLQNELRHYATSSAQTASLDAALFEINEAIALVPRVEDSRQYEAVDSLFPLPKQRKAGLPLDAARLFFTAHITRLGNLDKARIDDSERQVIEQRAANMKKAQHLYIGLQSTALNQVREPVTLYVVKKAV